MGNYWLDILEREEAVLGNRRFLEEAKDIEAKWKKSGLLDGIENPVNRQITAMLLESQRLVNEVTNG